MGKFTVFRQGQIDKALSDSRRQYFVGDLARPQDLPYIRDERVEFGLTAYQDYAAEAAHRHQVATEFQYVLSGRTQYLDTDTGEEHEFLAGDVYLIHPGTTYAQRSKPGTRILFVKVPSIDDKQTVEPPDEDVAGWLGQKLRTIRTDFFHDPDAPLPNSITPAAAVALLDSDGQLLVTRRSDSGNWTMPGGTQEYGESLPDCAVREVREECGISVHLTDVIGTYTDPEVRVGYSDGEVRQEFTILFAGGIDGDGAVVLDDESTEFRWVCLADATELELAPSQARRIRDVQAYVDRGTRHLG